MSWWRRLRLPVPLALALAALLALAGPAAAHVAMPASAPAVLEAADSGTVVASLSAAPEPAAPPGYLVAALALLAAVSWRRPRTVLVVALILLLGVFAFENAVHSVHHGFDSGQQEECAVAAVAAQLAAVEVADIGPASVLLAHAGRAEVTPSPLALSRFLSPDQGRAPPSAVR